MNAARPKLNGPTGSLLDWPSGIHHFTFWDGACTFYSSFFKASWASLRAPGWLNFGLSTS